MSEIGFKIDKFSLNADIILLKPLILNEIGWVLDPGERWYRFCIKMMGFILKTIDFVLNNDGLCIKNDGFCIKNDGFCIKYDGFILKWWVSEGLWDVMTDQMVCDCVKVRRTWHSAFGCWLLAAGCWLLAAGCLWLLARCFATSQLLLAACHSLLATAKSRKSRKSRNWSPATKPWHHLSFCHSAETPRHHSAETVTPPTCAALR